MNVSKIYKFDVANGEGIRVSLFVSGCDFKCKGCFNPESQNYNYGITYDNHIKKQVLDILKHPDYKGLSLLGGDPLRQHQEGLEQLIDLCKGVHALGKNVWIWSGYKYDEVMELPEDDVENKLRKELLNQADYFVEGKFIEEEKDLSLAWRGSKNQRVLHL